MTSPSALGDGLRADMRGVYFSWVSRAPPKDLSPEPLKDVSEKLRRFQQRVVLLVNDVSGSRPGADWNWLTLAHVRMPTRDAP
jgi:hypothetical protein